METLRMILAKADQRRFDEYRDGLVEFYTYRQALIERMSQP